MLILFTDKLLHLKDGQLFNYSFISVTETLLQLTE